MRKQATLAVAVTVLALGLVTAGLSLTDGGEPSSYPVDSGPGEPVEVPGTPPWVYLVIGLVQASLGAVILWLRKHHGYDDE